MSSMKEKILFLLILLFLGSKTALLQRRSFFGIESRWQRLGSCDAKKKVVEDTTTISQQEEEEFFGKLQELMSKTNIDGQRPNNFKRHERMSENLQNLKEIAVNMTLNTPMTSFEATNKQRTRKQVELQDQQRMEESRMDLDRLTQRPKGDNDDLNNIETEYEFMDKAVLESSSSLMNQQDMREMAKMYTNERSSESNAAESIRAIEEMVRQQQSPPSQRGEEESVPMENESTNATAAAVTSKGKNMVPNAKQKEVKAEGSSVPKVLGTEQVVNAAESARETREQREIEEMMQQQPPQEQGNSEGVSPKVATTSGTGKGKRTEIKGAASSEPNGSIEEQNTVTGSTDDITATMEISVPDPMDVASTKAKLRLKRAVDEFELMDGFRELMEAEAEQALYANGSTADGTNTTTRVITNINGTAVNGSAINGTAISGSAINGTTASNIKLKRMLCPVCSRPCEPKEMDDFGKCSICRADELEDRTILFESNVIERVATESMYLKRRKERQAAFAAEGAKQDSQLNKLQQQQLSATEIVIDGSIPKVAPDLSASAPDLSPSAPDFSASAPDLSTTNGTNAFAQQIP